MYVKLKTEDDGEIYFDPRHVSAIVPRNGGKAGCTIHMMAPDLWFDTKIPVDIMAQSLSELMGEDTPKAFNAQSYQPRKAPRVKKPADRNG